VLGDIKNLHRYVSKIEVNFQDHVRWYEAQKAAHAFAERFGIEIEADAAPTLSPIRSAAPLREWNPTDMKPIPVFEFPEIPYLPDFAPKI
jgi:hypothetical protein